jgi:hypothetical protein
MLCRRMAAKGKRAPRVSVQVEPDVYACVARLAKEQRRSVAAMLKILVEDAVRPFMAAEMQTETPPKAPHPRKRS